jgi:ATP-binding cassette, subfamily B, bacterial PglK
MFFKNLNILINKKEKKYFIIIFFTLLFGSTLETLSIAIFLPLINIIFNNSLKDNYWIDTFNQYFDITNENIVLVLSVIVFLFIVKNLFFLGFTYVKLKILNYYRQQKKQLLIRNYLTLNYYQFNGRKKSQLLRNIYHEIDNFTENFILSLIELIYIILILLGVLTFLLIYDLKITSILIFFILIFSTLFYFLTKKKLLIFGAERAKFAGLILKKIPNALNGFVEIKLFNLSAIVTEEFMKYQRRLDRIKIPQSLIANIPRSFIEIFIITIFSIFLIYQFKSNQDIFPVIAKLSIYIIVILKIVPYLNGISNLYSRIMRGYESCYILINEFEKKNENNKVQSRLIENFNNIIFKDVSFNYHDKDNKKELQIFDKINLSIKPHETIGIMGNSGSGKTTLLKLLIGFLNPTYGQITINKKNLYELDKKDLYKKISYIPQEPFFLYDTVVENIVSSNYFKDIDEKKVFDIIKQVHLDKKFINQNKIINEFIGENANNLSGGEKQRLALARVLYSDFEILILDEVTNKLDKKVSEEIMNLIYTLKKTKTIIIISHDHNTLNRCDYILELNNLKINKKI